MRIISCLTVLALTTTPVLAQNPQTTAPQNPVAPVAPPNAPTPPPEQIAPPSGSAGGTTSGATGGSLSDNLSRQRGTISPPMNVDPGITVQPNRSTRGTTPVIPPPGSPGGNQSVVPK